MKPSPLFLIFASFGYAHGGHAQHHAQLVERQAPSPSNASGAIPATPATPNATGAPHPAAPTSAVAPPPAISPPVAQAPPAGPYAGLTASNAPPLASITSGMALPPLPTLAKAFPPGSSPLISGAPPIPTFVFSPADWPAQDKVPDTNNDKVKGWMKELDGVNVPSFAPTVDGSCVGDPSAAADAANRGWWTCGAYTRSTDVVTCPDKMTWGVSFDDGPSPYTPALLNYLDTVNVKSTFFVVGSRVISYPATLVAEYMQGHEIAVHTWSHRPLTSLTNEQVVAELGWTRAAIKAVIGVTPIYMRPPFGDIDDRVRAISLAMGLIPIVWTRTDATGPFDTNDWKVAGGIVTGVQQYDTFEKILGTAATLNSGFIVLAHDLYPETVELAVGYVIPAAMKHNPAFNLMAIGTCSKVPSTNLYRETNSNTTFPAPKSGGSVARAGQSAGNGAAAVGLSPTVSLSIASLLLGTLWLA